MAYGFGSQRWWKVGSPSAPPPRLRILNQVLFSLCDVRTGFAVPFRPPSTVSCATDERKRFAQEAANMPDSDSSLPKLQYPEWQGDYQAALLELDPKKLFERVAAAEAVIFNRLQGIAQNPDHTLERQAIDD